MDEDKEIQILVKKTPAFTVLKNGSILKNIFLLCKSPPSTTEQSAADTSLVNQEPDEEILLVGRHPNCNITLEHPSISRYHLRIHTNPSSLKLSVVDLSSVHGTWVSGKRIQPGVPVKLKEGDTVKMGGSSRIYELHWVPLSQAFDVDDPFVPATFIKQQETQDENSSYLERLATNSSNDENSTKEEPFSVLKCSKSCCDDTETQHSTSPSKSSFENGENCATVSIHSPFIVSESVSETEIFDNLNKSEDLSLSLSDSIKTPEKDLLNQEIARGNKTDMGTENEQMNQIKMTDESDSMVLCTSREEIDTGVKFESMDLEINKKESVFMALLDETDMNQERIFTPEISRNKEVLRTHFDSLDGKELEFFTPDKENKDPNCCSKRSLRRKWMEDENKQSNNCSVNEGKKDIFGFSRNQSVCCEEVLFSSEKEGKSRSMKMEESGNFINYPQAIKKVIDSSNVGAKKRWIMVLDINTLLHNKSLKHLKLLQGLKGTQLFVPKIVLKELMDIKGQHDLFNRTTKKVSLALKWLEECRITTRWWIHMDDEIEKESSVLESVIQLCKEIKDGKIVILSNDVSLKIESMAKGIMCEEVEEFFRSLVNPFSERFMWIGSLARGLNWSCVDDDYFLREKYGKFGVNVSNRFKGLKLLAHITTL